MSRKPRVPRVARRRIVKGRLTVVIPRECARWTVATVPWRPRPTIVTHTRFRVVQRRSSIPAQTRACTTQAKTVLRVLLGITACHDEHWSTTINLRRGGNTDRRGRHVNVNRCTACIVHQVVKIQKMKPPRKGIIPSRTQPQFKNTSTLVTIHPKRPPKSLPGSHTHAFHKTFYIPLKFISRTRLWLLDCIARYPKLTSGKKQDK